MVRVDIRSEVARLFDPSSLVSSGQPNAIILVGGVAAGKTTLRIKEYSQGFVVIDSAEMFHHMSIGHGMLDFPDALIGSLEIVGRLVTERAITERRNIVTEIIGAEFEPVQDLMIALTQVGYRVEVIAVTCELEESYRRAETRGDNISAYYAERFQRQWLIDTCRQNAP